MRRLIKPLAAASLALSFMFTSSGALRAETVVLAATDWPPYEFAKPEDGLRGFDVEVVEAAFNRVQIFTEFEFFPWKRALEMTKRGLYSGIITCSYRPEREEFILYSDQLSQSTYSFFVRRDFKDFEPSSLQEVKGRRVGSVLGYAQIKWLEDAEAEIVTSRSEELVFRNLLKGVVDYVFLATEASGFIAKQLGISQDMRTLKIRENKLYICFSKKSKNVEEIAQKFNEGLALVKADGTYKAIHDKYR